jgi:tRNA-Thr(GGU) m(6)t(6)A37 methyltransferase TsaA
MQHNPQTRCPALTAVEPIGVIHTPFTAVSGTPIQSAAAGEAEGVVEIFPRFVQGLADIEGLERLWLIYLFHRAAPAQLMVRPFLDNAEHGIFATRSPARPNHLGLSPVRLLRVEQNRLYVSQVDMIDGSPLLDIKPYVPEFDHFAVTRTGWYKGKSPKGVVADDRFALIDPPDSDR